MHESVRAWVSHVVESYGLRGADTLEIGSLIVNGTIRGLFETEGSVYVGADMREGLGVDVVVPPGSCLPRHVSAGRPTAGWPCIVSTEMLEHDPRPWLSFQLVARALRPGGLFVATTRAPGFPIHDHPGDFWRFTHSAMQVLCADAGLEVLEQSDDVFPGHPGVFLVARRPEVGDGDR